jgi:hypothetical protein
MGSGGDDDDDDNDFNSILHAAWLGYGRSTKR